MRRAMLWRIVRRMLRLEGLPVTLQFDRKALAQALFDQVGQFEVLEEHVEELFLRQRELERVLALAVGAAFPAAAALAALRPRDLVAAEIFLVAGDDVVALAGAAVVVKGRLGDPAGRDRHLLAVLDVGDLALAQGVLHRVLDLGPGAPEEPLAVAQALALRVRATVDDVHETLREGNRTG
jgi:hypothetical protein